MESRICAIYIYMYTLVTMLRYDDIMYVYIYIYVCIYMILYMCNLCKAQDNMIKVDNICI